MVVVELATLKLKLLLQGRRCLRLGPVPLINRVDAVHSLLSLLQAEQGLSGSTNPLV